MENKYYEPDVEDFYVGMVYETEQDELRGIWEENTINTLRELEELCKYNSKYIGKYSNIRVKYLDSSDIESFGFKCDTFSESKFMYGKFADEFSIKIKHNDFFVKYFYDDNHLIIVVHNNEMMDPGEESILFNGVVKNKSELKVILKQIRIINE